MRHVQRGVSDRIPLDNVNTESALQCILESHAAQIRWALIEPGFLAIAKVLQAIVEQASMACRAPTSSSHVRDLFQSSLPVERWLPIQTLLAITCRLLQLGVACRTTQWQNLRRCCTHQHQPLGGFATDPFNPLLLFACACVLGTESSRFD